MLSSAQTRPTERMDGEHGAIRSDHAALRRCAERIDEQLARLVEGTGSSGDAVRSLLEEFRVRLLRHLSAEEQAGIMQQAVAVEPRFARRVEQLLVEHADLRRGAGDLAAGPDGSNGAPDWGGFHARFVAFRSVLEAHEGAENEVLQCVYLEDLGGRG